MNLTPANALWWDGWPIMGSDESTRYIPRIEHCFHPGEEVGPILEDDPLFLEPGEHPITLMLRQDREFPNAAYRTAMYRN